MTDEVKQLVKEIDELVGKKRDERLAAFVVLLTDEPREQTSTLKSVAKQEKIAHTPLTTYKSAAGPGKYRIHKNADVTVMMWVENDVKVNHAYTKGQLDTSAIKQIVSDTTTILN